MLHAVVMAGGKGTRFWPASRQQTPKQLLPLLGDRSMLQQTLDRLEGWIPPAQQWVVTNEQLAAPIKQQLPQLPPGHLILESAPRNTAPCLALAAMELLSHDPEAVMLVLSADHLIEPAEQFRADVETGLDVIASQAESLVLFGAPPQYPATGYGYIERAQQLPSKGAFAVKQFREKPDRATAETYVREGTFYWNCGLFLWRAETLVQGLMQHAPELMDPLLRWQSKWQSPEARDAINAIFPDLKSISIDYALLEKSTQCVVVESRFDWDDIGSWLALERRLGSDETQNCTTGQTLLVDSTGCLVKSTDDHLIAVMGAQDLIVVHTSDATLILPRDQEQNVGQIVEQLRLQNRNEYL